MNRPLEDLLSETLREYAGESREVVGLTARVVKKGELVRRRRRVAAVAASVVVAVGFAGLLLPGRGFDRAAPPANQSSPAATQQPMSAEELAVWVKGLPEGPPTELTYQNLAGTVTAGTRAVFTSKTGVITQPIAVPGGTLAMLIEEVKEQEATSSLVLIRDDGSARRFVTDQLHGFAVSPAGRSAALVVSSDPTVGATAIQVIDLVSGEATDSFTLKSPSSESGVFVAGWAGRRVIWNEFGPSSGTVWSWLPGQQPQRVIDGTASAAEGDLIALLPDMKGGTTDAEECVRLVRLDQPEEALSPNCLALLNAISPDAKYFLTQESLLVERATGKSVFTHRPIEDEDRWLIAGWEKDAVVAQVALGDEREAVLVRCRFSDGECERVAVPDVAEREVRFE